MAELRQAGQHIVVTGAGTGIGRAIALRLAREGAQLTLLARDVGRLQETAAQIQKEDLSTPFVHACDIADAEQVDRAFQAAWERQGPLRGLVANAGIGGPNEPGDDDRFHTLIAVNLVGTYQCLRAAQSRLTDEGVRHLVVVSSVLARIGVPGYTGYCASKTGLLGLTRALAAELAGREIQVNALCPGWVNTQMARDGVAGMAGAMGVSYDEAHAMAMSAVPLGRMSEPADVAGMVAWLVSADARGVTGQALDMNGGAFMS